MENSSSSRHHVSRSTIQARGQREIAKPHDGSIICGSAEGPNIFLLKEVTIESNFWLQYKGAIRCQTGLIEVGWSDGGSGLWSAVVGAMGEAFGR